ncbi:NAD(P)-dependent oxidoreductase [Cypionkella sinensis]|uniref:NAD(P)-dependent oxidoreductase n=1 Tax=Cypionkella sinensis TaxID=1756043 RepID=A0ABV7J7C6_9RHOB
MRCNTLKVGFIGLGDQGGPMAEALAETHELYVWARRPKMLAGFANKGARLMETAQAVARSVEVLCLCLPGDAELHDLVFDGGLADALPHGATVINHATGDPDTAALTAERLTAKGLRYLDAPVGGGRPSAASRSLTCFVGGDADTLCFCTPVIARHSSNIRLMGGPGAGQMTKLLNNALTVSNLRNLVEVFCLAARAGVNLLSLQAALATSSGGSFFTQLVCSFSGWADSKSQQGNFRGVCRRPKPRMAKWHAAAETTKQTQFQEI